MFLKDILGLYTTRPIVNTSDRSNSIHPSSALYAVISAIALWAVLMPMSASIHRHYSEHKRTIPSCLYPSATAASLLSSAP